MYEEKVVRKNNSKKGKSIELQTNRDKLSELSKL